MGIGEIIGYSALGISGLVFIFSASRLGTAVFAFLVTWAVVDFVLEYYNSYEFLPSVPVGLAINFTLLWYLSKLKIWCVVTPAVVGLCIAFAGYCILARMMGVENTLEYYGRILGTAALLAALEGAYDGYRCGFRNYTLPAWVGTGPQRVLHRIYHRKGGV